MQRFKGLFLLDLIFISGNIDYQKNEPELTENLRPLSNISSDGLTHHRKGIGMTDSNVVSLHGLNADAALNEVGTIGVNKHSHKSTPHSDNRSAKLA